MSRHPSAPSPSQSLTAAVVFFLLSVLVLALALS